MIENMIGDQGTMPSMLGRIGYKLLRIPIIGSAIQNLLHHYSLQRFPGSESYWLKRYARGGDSGQGSYDKLAEQKAEVINRFVTERQVTSVIEFGCGDGNQLRLANYPSYIGYDISPTALARCKELFKSDPSKSFYQMKEYKGETADLTLSLDVIFHLIEDDVFETYMHRLFAASNRFVIVYSSNQIDQKEVIFAHVKHRLFTAWVDAQMPEWKLIQHIPNRYPFADDPVEGSFADFYIYERRAS